MRNFKMFFKTTVGMKPQSETGGTSTKEASAMKHFTEFKKTTVGMKPQSESGSEKKADDAAQAVMRGAFGSKGDSPAPAPAPADVSTGGLGSQITASIGRAIGG